MLEIPWIYNSVQFIFGSPEFKKVVEFALNQYSNQDVLELGSGTGAFSPQGFRNLTVTDVNQDYLNAIEVSCNKVLASAAKLPFENSSFNLVFAVGLYHHLSDEDYALSMQEIKRVLRPGGRFLNIDNVPPTQSRRFIAGLVRKLDRGMFVRTQANQLKLMESQFSVIESRIGSYSWCGLEYSLVLCEKSGKS